MSNLFEFDKLKESVKLCDVHHERMFYAYGKVRHKFPLTETSYERLSKDELSYLDQLIFRFSKLQDSMGRRIFPDLLEALGEDIYDKPFIDKLNLLERLELLDDHKSWLSLRETRNLVTHEYPIEPAEIIEGLNDLAHGVETLSGIWENLKSYIQDRFKLENK